MSSYVFHSDDPSLHGLDVAHGNFGLHLERLMMSPHYTNRNDPLNMRAMSDVREGMALLYGEGPAKGSAGQTMSFDSATGQIIDRTAPAQPVMVPTGGGGFAPMVFHTGPAPVDMPAPMLASGTGQADEHNTRDLP